MRKLKSTARSSSSASSEKLWAVVTGGVKCRSLLVKLSCSGFVFIKKGFQERRKEHLRRVVSLAFGALPVRNPIRAAKER